MNNEKNRINEPLIIRDSTFLKLITDKDPDVIEMIQNICLSLESPFSGKFPSTFNISDVVPLYTRMFLPSETARQTYLHLHVLASIDAGPSHFTYREGLESYLLIHTLEGQGYLKYCGNEYDLKQNDVALIDCRQLHDYRTVSKSRWVYRAVHFDGYSMSTYFTNLSQAKVYKFSFVQDSLFFRLMNDLFTVNSNNGANREIVTNSLLTNIVTEILLSLPQYENSHMPERIMAICDWIEGNCTKGISVDYVADRFSISKYYLCREFKKHTGTTVIDYVNSCRINIAKTLLMIPGLSIYDVASQSGFDNQSYFTDLFKKKTGFTPGNYKKQWGSF